MVCTSVDKRIAKAYKGGRQGQRQGGKTHQVKSHPPEENSGGTEAAAIVVTGGRAGCGARGPHAGRPPSSSARGRVFEGEAALGVGGCEAGGEAPC